MCSVVSREANFVVWRTGSSSRCYINMKVLVVGVKFQEVPVLDVKAFVGSRNDELSSLRHPGSSPTGNCVQMQQELAHDRHHRDIARLTTFTQMVIEVTNPSVVSDYRPRVQVEGGPNRAPTAADSAFDSFPSTVAESRS